MWITLQELVVHSTVLLELPKKCAGAPFEISLYKFDGALLTLLGNLKVCNTTILENYPIKLCLGNSPSKPWV